MDGCTLASQLPSASPGSLAKVHELQASGVAFLELMPAGVLWLMSKQRARGWSLVGSSEVQGTFF
jgi:hypothetical protein